MPEKRRIMFFRSAKERALNEWHELSVNDRDHRFHLALEAADLDPQEKDMLLDTHDRALGSLDKLVETHEKLHDMRGVQGTAPEDLARAMGPKLDVLQQSAYMSVREASSGLVTLASACKTIGLPGPLFDGDPSDGAYVRDAAAKWHQARTGLLPASLAPGQDLGVDWDHRIESRIPEAPSEKAKGWTPRKIAALDESVLPLLPEGDLRNAAFDTLRNNGLGRRLWAVEPPSENGSILVCSTPDYIGHICTLIPESKITYERGLSKDPVAASRFTKDQFTPEQWKGMSLNERLRRFKAASDSFDWKAYCRSLPFDPDGGNADHMQNLESSYTDAMEALERLPRDRAAIRTVSEYLRENGGGMDWDKRERLRDDLDRMYRGEDSDISSAEFAMWHMDEAAGILGLPGTVWGGPKNSEQAIEAADAWLAENPDKARTSEAKAAAVLIPEKLLARGFKPEKLGSLSESDIGILPPGDLRNAGRDGRLYAVSPMDPDGYAVVCDSPDYVGKICARFPVAQPEPQKEMAKTPARTHTGRGAASVPGKSESATARCLAAAEEMRARSGDHEMEY